MAQTPKGRARIAAAALDILSRSIISGHTLTLPEGDLDTQGLREIIKMFMKAGTKFKGLTFTFPDPDIVAQTIEILKGTFQFSEEAQPSDIFPLTAELADLLVDQLPGYSDEELKELRILVPGGSLLLIDALIRRYGEWKGLIIETTAADKDQRRQLLKLNPVDVDISIAATDFLEWDLTIAEKYDIVISNPPGRDDTSLRYLDKGWNHLKRDGVIVCLVPARQLGEVNPDLESLSKYLTDREAIITLFDTANYEARLIRIKRTSFVERSLLNEAAEAGEIYIPSPPPTFPGTSSVQPFLSFSIDRGSGPAQADPSESQALLPSLIAVNYIEADPDQPRRRLSEPELRELAASISRHGILQPISVRLTGIKEETARPIYTIIFGERRWRAAKIAGLTHIRAYIRDISEEEVMDIQIVENHQRADVHPMEDAIFFGRMMKTPGRTHHDIAARINVGEKYVRTRLKLTNLLPEWQAFFLNNWIEFSTALSISGASHETQLELLSRTESAIENREEGELIQLHNLKFFLDSRAHDLSEAPFSITDPTLNPKMGSCIGCIYNSASSSLFADENPTCKLPGCYRTKSINGFTAELRTHAAAGTRLVVPQESMGDDEKFWIGVAKETGVDLLSPACYDIIYSDADKSAPDVILAYCVAGRNRRQMIPIRILVDNHQMGGSHASGSDHSGENNSLETLSSHIMNMTARAARAKELDGERLWRDVRDLALGKYDAAGSLPGIEISIEEGELSQIERGAISAILYGSSNFHPRRREASVLADALGIESGPQISAHARETLMLEALITQADDRILRFLLRSFLLANGFPQSGSPLKSPAQDGALEFVRIRKTEEVRELQLDYNNREAKRQRSLEARIKAEQRNKADGPAAPVSQDETTLKP